MLIIQIRISLFVLLSFLSIRGFADKRSDIDSIVNAYITSTNNAGLIVGIVKGGRTEVYSYGSVSKTKLQKPDTNTVFEIGSITKVYTAILLSSLIHDSILNLHDPVQKYLPDSVKVPKYNNKEITLYHLATHTSGLPRLPENLWETVTDSGNPYKDYTVKHMYDFLSGYKPLKEPGKEYEYSNLGMGLLGNILSVKAGMKYEDMVISKICDEFEMNDTRISLSSNQLNRLAQGHDEKGNPVSNWDLPCMAGAGALRSTVNDMLKFLNANLNTSQDGNGGMLEFTHTFRAKTNRDDVNVGLAWHIFHVDEDTIVWHNGGTGGYRSFMGFIKETKTGVVVLSNSANSVDQIGIKTIKLLHD